MKHKHEWETTFENSSPKTGKAISSGRRCRVCGVRQYRWWRYNNATGQYRTGWISGPVRQHKEKTDG